MRDSDVPTRHTARLARYRAHLPAISAEIGALRVALEVIAADVPAARFIAAGWAAYRRLTATTAPSVAADRSEP